MSGRTTKDNTMGALQIGSLFAVFLFGIVTLQCHVYFRRFSDDRMMFKLLVGSVWALELGHTVAVSNEVYRTTIFGLQNLSGFPGFGAAVILGAIITTCIQGFFAIRAWRVLPSPYRYIGPICIVLSLVRCGTSFYVGSKIIYVESFVVFRSEWTTLVSFLLAMGAAIDIAIAAAMLYFLIQRRESALSRVARLIDRLVAYTIRTGLVTSLAAVAVLICFQVMPYNLVWLCLYSFLAKLYSNTLLSALNGREDLRNSVTNSGSEPTHATKTKNPMRRGASVLDSTRLQTYGQAISIEMNTTSEVAVDGMYFPKGMDKADLESPQSSTGKNYPALGDRVV